MLQMRLKMQSATSLITEIMYIFYETPRQPSSFANTPKTEYIMLLPSREFNSFISHLTYLYVANDIPASKFAKCELKLHVLSCSSYRTRSSFFGDFSNEPQLINPKDMLELIIVATLTVNKLSETDIAALIGFVRFTRQSDLINSIRRYRFRVFHDL